MNKTLWQTFEACCCFPCCQKWFLLRLFKRLSNHWEGGSVVWWLRHGWTERYEGLTTAVIFWDKTDYECFWGGIKKISSEERSGFLNSFQQECRLWETLDFQGFKELLFFLRIQRCWQRSRSCKSSHPMPLAVAKSEDLWNDLELLNQYQIPQKKKKSLTFFRGDTGADRC